MESLRGLRELAQSLGSRKALTERLSKQEEDMAAGSLMKSLQQTRSRGLGDVRLMEELGSPSNVSSREQQKEVR